MFNENVELCVFIFKNVLSFRCQHSLTQRHVSMEIKMCIGLI